ncbi:MAG: MBL fold metallo-hydrolase [Spirochaetes bacterium]|nr:MBL fold metallo-hydrolase [Spirochaetota bacterium]
MKILAEGTINTFCQAIGHIGYPSYIIKGYTKSMMIDAGINLLAPKYYSDLVSLFGEPIALDYVAITHSHYDHLGAIPYLLKKIPNVSVVGAKRIQDLLSKQTVIDFMTHLSNIQKPLFADIVDNEDVSLSYFDITYPVKEGDCIDLGDITCVVYEVPGHTRDSLAYFFPEIGMLCAGEAVGVPQGINGEIVQVEFLSSYDDYCKSLEKMLSLKPQTLCMAHGFVYTDDDVTKFLELSITSTEQYKELLLQYLDRVNGDIEKAIELITIEEYDKKGLIYQERNAYISNLSAQVKLVAKEYNYIKG